MKEYTNKSDQIHVLRYDNEYRKKTIESVILKGWWGKSSRTMPSFTLYKNKKLGAALFLVKDMANDLITYEDLCRISEGESVPQYSFDSFRARRNAENISDIMVEILGTSHTARIEKYCVSTSYLRRVETQKSELPFGIFFDYWIVVYIPDNIEIVKCREELHEKTLGFRNSEYVCLYKNGELETIYYNADSNSLYTESGIIEDVQILRIEKIIREKR